MTDITVYKPSRDPNARDYPDKIDSLIDTLQGYVTEIEQARNSYGTLKIGLVSYAGATANIPLAGYRITGAAGSGYASDELIPKSYADAVGAAANSYTDGLIALKSARSGDTYAGTHNFMGATVNVATAAPGASGSAAASLDFVNSLAFSSSMPGLAGNALKYARVNAAETSIEYAEVDTYRGRVVRTSSTTLVNDDIGKLIDITSGTFTQTFTAAATLGAKWWCYLRNSGSGDITLDPNGSEQIDGLASYVMYPGETRLVTCNGAGFFTIVLTSYYRTFTSGGTWTKPPGYAAHSGLLWGGGGGGARATLNSVLTGGGGGGACCPFTFGSNSLAATVTVVIGSGGAATTTAGTYAGTGGQSQFHTATAYGGGGAYALASGTAEGGGGGGILSAGANGTNASTLVMGGGPVSINAGSLGFNALHNTGFGGGCAWTAYAGDSAYGGGAGGAAGGKSIYGGGGGSGQVASPGGTSVFGGAGGTGFYGGSGNATSPGIPAGGGGSVGGAGTGAPSAGARGELRIWGVR